MQTIHGVVPTAPRFLDWLNRMGATALGKKLGVNRQTVMAWQRYARGETVTWAVIDGKRRASVQVHRPDTARARSIVDLSNGFLTIGDIYPELAP